MQIALLPLDERPVNVRLPADVAAVAGVDVTVPAASALPRMREPGDVHALAGWLEDACLDPRTDAAVVSIEMLLHGGLIASRLSEEAPGALLDRYGVLRAVRAARPDLPVAAVGVVMRASDSYVADEEPAYWSEHGRELHALGGDLHRRFLAGMGVADGADQPDDHADDRLAALPAHVRGDFLRRRLRNHVVGLAALELASEGVVDPLLITADDTASRSAGSLEQLWLRHWADALCADRVLMHPGADEVGAVLVSRGLAVLDPRPVRFAVVCAERDGLGRVAPYENSPVGQGAACQVRASGSELAGAGVAADAVLVVHAPDPDGRDWRANVPVRGGEEQAVATARTVREALGGGAEVGLADVRYANGADPVLVDVLRAEGLLTSLSAYGAWNTAGNTIGSVVAALRAGVIGKRAGTFDQAAARRLLAHRVLEDWGYQAVVRTRLTAQGDLRGVPGERGEAELRYVERATAELGGLLADVFPGASLEQVRLPWARAFEVDFDVRLPVPAEERA